ncbi:MAG: DUF4743 domain-containing protein [Pseudomonadota bacterium]
MSLLDRIEACQFWQPQNYRPFAIDGERFGNIRQDLVQRLIDFPKVFHVTDTLVTFHERLTDFDSRSAAMADVVASLRAAGEIRQWRDEFYPVTRSWDVAPKLKMERGAVPDFGVRAYGVHMNGLAEKADGLHLWVARRSMTKQTAPGKLDHLVAGGQPHGMGILENLIKECGEEASIPPDLASRAQPIGLVSYVCARPEGLRDDICFCYDLMLPEGFKPENTDGEVDDFFLWPIEKVIDVLAAGEDFKFNCALVIIDLLVRKGYLTPDQQDYQAIVSGLRLAD